MTDDKLTIELAQQGLSDVTHLEKSEPFNRYFVRRLKERRAKIFNSFYTEGADKVSADEREILRRKCLEYDDLLAMLASDGARFREVVEQHMNADTDETKRIRASFGG